MHRGNHMKKEDLLQQIADKGYDVGFGAKKHLATYDIICKAPGWISFGSIVVGIIVLATNYELDSLSSALLIIFGISALYIEPYYDKKDSYETAGKKMTGLFHSLKALYARVEHENGGDLEKYIIELKEIDSQFQDGSISKQIFISDLYAHYKFFGQMQINWIEKSRPFSLWRDKIPFTAYPFLIFIIVVVVIILFFKG